MSRTSPWHSRLERPPHGVYHNETRCRTGNNIERWNRVSGTGGLRHCKECADWQNGRRTY